MTELEQVRTEEALRFLPSGRSEVLDYEQRESGHVGKLLPLAQDQAVLAEILEGSGVNVPRGAVIDVYNPSVIFEHSGVEYIAGRVELAAKAAELDSVTVFFRHEGDRWRPLREPRFKLQDPSITFIDGEMFLSGTELSVKPATKRWTVNIRRLRFEMEEKSGVAWRTVFYRGPNFEQLDRFAEGPWGMKGIKVIKTGGGVGVYVRPQSEGNPGQIGYTTVESIEDLRGSLLTKVASEAPLLKYRFPPGEWGGPNQVKMLIDGRHLVIGHRAYYSVDKPTRRKAIDEGRKRNYVPWACVYDPRTGEMIDLGVLAVNADFPSCRAKAPDLKNVLYTGGVMIKNDRWFLVVGISDTHSGLIEIENPLTRLDLALAN